MNSETTSWPAKFLIAFIPTFLATGVSLGTVYVLLMRSLRIDRENVEAWFENQRKRLRSGRPIPIIEKAQPVMIGALYAVYGRTALRRFVASFFVAVIFTSMMFGVVYWRYTHERAVMRTIKSQLERETDPVLYDYATNPQLRSEYEKSQETMTAYNHQGMKVGTNIYEYSGGIYDELRKRTSTFEPRLVANLFANPNRVELALLFIFDGTYLDPGFEWIYALSLFGFNVFLDFFSVTIMIHALQLLEDDTSVQMAVITSAQALCGTLLSGALGFLSYRLFFRGDIAVFWQLLVAFPLSSGAMLLGIHAVVSLFDRKKDTDMRWLLGLSAVALIGGAFFGFRYIWSYWQAISFGIVNWHDLFFFPYVLAATTFVPATMSMAAFGLMLIAKVTAEPARVVPEAYMTFVKEELGGTQAAGIIVVLSAAVGAIAGLIWH